MTAPPGAACNIIPIRGYTIRICIQKFFNLLFFLAMRGGFNMPKKVENNQNNTAFPMLKTAFPMLKTVEQMSRISGA